MGLRILVIQKREEEVAIAIEKREEIMEAVQNCEREVDSARPQHEQLIKKEGR